MTIFLCVLSVLAMAGAGSYTIKGPMPPRVLLTLQTLDVVMALGFATLALWSYLS